MEREHKVTAYDPKLKECARKIEALCEEYDCGAHISLVSQTHGEFRFILPKWTGLYRHADPKTGDYLIRLKIKKAEGKKVELTAHFLHSLRDTAASQFNRLDKFIKVTDEKWKTEHKPFHNFRPHREEN